MNIVNKVSPNDDQIAPSWVNYQDTTLLSIAYDNNIQENYQVNDIEKNIVSKLIRSLEGSNRPLNIWNLQAKQQQKQNNEVSNNPNNRKIENVKYHKEDRKTIFTKRII